MSCGSNNHGQLGLGDTKNRLVLTPVGGGLRRVVDIAAGFNHSIAATLEGDVFTWGIGEEGGMRNIYYISNDEGDVFTWGIGEEGGRRRDVT